MCENMCTCGELNLYFSLSAGGFKKKKTHATVGVRVGVRARVGVGSTPARDL